MNSLVLTLALAASPVADAAEPIKISEHQVLYSTEGAFSEIKENLQFAIENQGLVINYTAQVGDMLERTGSDLGFTDHTYLAGDVVEFCSADLTRRMVEADPTNLVFCPYAVHFYELTAEPGTIYVGYKRPLPVGNDASRAALGEIDDLLKTIVTEALSW